MYDTNIISYFQLMMKLFKPTKHFLCMQCSVNLYKRFICTVMRSQVQKLMLWSSFKLTNFLKWCGALKFSHHVQRRYISPIALACHRNEGLPRKNILVTSSREGGTTIGRWYGYMLRLWPPSFLASQRSIAYQFPINVSFICTPIFNF